MLRVKKNALYRLNNNGESTDPCGSPFLSFLGLLISDPIITWKTLSLSMFSINLDGSLQGILRRNLYITPSLHTVSYAADKSMNATELFSPL